MNDQTLNALEALEPNYADKLSPAVYLRFKNCTQYINKFNAQRYLYSKGENRYDPQLFHYYAEQILLSFFYQEGDEWMFDQPFANLFPAHIPMGDGSFMTLKELITLAKSAFTSTARTPEA